MRRAVQRALASNRPARLGLVVLAAALGGLAQDSLPLPLNRTIDPKAPRWRAVAISDSDDAAVSFRAIHLGDSQCVIAWGTGVTRKAPTPRGVVFRSIDGGQTWALVNVAEIPRSGFLLGAKLGWMVTDRGVWRTGDCGATWQKLWSHDLVNAVWFLDEVRGFAVGAMKQAWATTDGGRHWTKIEEAAKNPGAPERSYYSTVEFAGETFGVMTGLNQPRRADTSSQPDWLDPEAAMRRRQLPNLMLTLQTVNGGKTWLPSSTSILGAPSRIRLRADGVGLTLIEFLFAFDWPAEVYRMDPAQNKSERVFREKDRAITDVALLSTGAAYVAGIEPPGTLRNVPVPGRVRIAGSMDQIHWREMAVDYRAMGTRVYLASRPEGPVFAATDQGMILTLGH